jgi:glucosylceramidase
VASTTSGGSRTTNLVHVAFRTPAGRYVLVAMNDGKTTQSFNVGYGGRIVTTSLAVGAVATYVW